MTTLTYNDTFKEIMAQNYGSETFYKHHLNGTFLLKGLHLFYTEGVRDLAMKCQCYWLIDEIAYRLPKVRKNNIDCQDLMQTVVIRVKDRKCKVYFQHDKGEKKFCQFEIGFTDLQTGEYKLYLIAQDITCREYTLLLPPEY